MYYFAGLAVLSVSVPYTQHTYIQRERESVSVICTHICHRYIIAIQVSFAISKYKRTDADLKLCVWLIGLNPSLSPHIHLNSLALATDFEPLDSLTSAFTKTRQKLYDSI